LEAKEIQFGGYTWTVRTGRGGPGPNAWDENNVWLDSATNLHLEEVEVILRAFKFTPESALPSHQRQ